MSSHNASQFARVFTWFNEILQSHYSVKQIVVLVSQRCGHHFQGRLNTINIPPRKRTWQWNIHHLKMYFLLNMGIFQCHLSFQGCIGFKECSRESESVLIRWIPSSLIVVSRGHTHEVCPIRAWPQLWSMTNWGFLANMVVELEGNNLKQDQRNQHYYCSL